MSNPFKEVLFSMVCAGSFLLAYRRIVARKRSPATLKWPWVVGNITRSTHEHGNPHTGQCDTTDLRYSYQVDGSTYEGTRLTLLDYRTDLADAHVRYPVGAHVMVYYNPADPGEAVLEPGTGREVFGRSRVGTILFWLSQSALGALGLFALYVAYIDPP